MLSVRGGVKGGYFSVSLTVSNLPPPPLHCSFDLTLWVKVFWKRFCTRKRQLSSNYWNPQFLLLMLQPSRSSFARGRPLRMTICKRPVPPDDHLQEAGPFEWSFARVRPLPMIIWMRSAHPDDNLQKAGPSRSRGRPLILTTTKRHEKWIFETLHTKKSQKADQRGGGVNAYDQPDRKKSVF